MPESGHGSHSGPLGAVPDRPAGRARAREAQQQEGQALRQVRRGHRHQVSPQGHLQGGKH